jgi:23S rRNA (guanosine2251-2'-O)-methyltransferase
MANELLFGLNTALEIVKAGKRKIYRLIISRGEQDKKVHELVTLARARGAAVEFSEPAVLEKLAKGGNHQGVILETEPVKKLDITEALAFETDLKKTVWAALDGITDPMNLGAIIRSAACFGVSAIIIPERRSVGVTPTVQKAASGALEKVNIVECVNLNQTILALKEKGFWVYGADMNGKRLDKTDFALPALVIIGSEGSGMHLKTREHCDEVVSIAQKGGVESLNASAAAAVLFYEISKKL